MSVSDIKIKLYDLYNKIAMSDYQKENYPVEIEDVIGHLGECIDILENV